LDFRREFQRDVVIDMYCYRQRGHNEGDEPALTQPVIYRTIEHKDPVPECYLEHLLLLGGISVEEATQIVEKRRALLEQELVVARSPEYAPAPELPTGISAGYLGQRLDAAHNAATGVGAERLSGLLEALTKVPDNFHL